jgi:hypothetical protein
MEYETSLTGVPKAVCIELAVKLYRILRALPR